MDYIWNNNVPIAIKVTSGEWTPNELQKLANDEDLPVRDERNNKHKRYTPDG